MVHGIACAVYAAAQILNIVGIVRCLIILVMISGKLIILDQCMILGLVFLQDTPFCFINKIYRFPPDLLERNGYFRYSYSRRKKPYSQRSYLYKTMICIVTAMYAEAHPFITRFQLKKDISHTRFQVFLNEEAGLCLIITGTGSVPAAAAVSSLCTEYRAGQGDFLLNVGICAQIQNENETTRMREHPRQTGDIYLCNKIWEQATGRTFYPDILYRHRFAEAQIVTGPAPYKRSIPAPACLAAYRNTPLSGAHGKSISGGTAADTFCLYDMEAAAVYQAGSYYFGPHQMSFLKVISDDGSPESVTSAQIGRLIVQNMETIADYIKTLQTILRQESLQKDALPQELEQLCLDLHCSRTMSESLRQHIRYCILSGTDYASVLKEMYREGKLPCRNKREGKQYFEELKERLLL